MPYERRNIMFRKNKNKKSEHKVFMNFVQEVSIWWETLQMLEIEKRFSEANRIREALKASIVKDTIEAMSTPFMKKEVERLASSIT